MGTIKFIGEEDFLRICKKHNLSGNWIEVVRAILKGFDECEEMEKEFSFLKEKINKDRREILEPLKGTDPKIIKKIIAILWEVNTLRGERLGMDVEKYKKELDSLF